MAAAQNIPISRSHFTIDVILLTLVIGATFCLFIYLPIQIFPADDALILFRYAENLSHTGVISYNPGEPPVEGATDFLWMILLAILNVCGINTYAAALLLSLISLGGTSYLLYRLLGKSTISIYYIILLFLLYFKTIFSAILGFSTLFFGFFIAFTYYLNNKHSTAVYLCSLITCLIRPDGVVFIFPVILDSLFKNKKYFYRKLQYFFLLFIIPGIIYFLWRYDYFGFLFPLPFYIKNTSKIINYDSLYHNIKFNILFSFSYLIILFYIIKQKINICSNIKFKYIFFFLFPFLFYSKVDLLQNIGDRFQFPFVIIHLVIIIAIIKKFNIPLKYLSLCLIITLCLSAGQTYRYFLSTYYSKYINLYHISKNISEKPINALLLTTESGIMPYYTQWHTIDAFGLNSPDFTKKIITSQNVQEIKPDVVLINYWWNLYEFIDEGKSYPDFQNKSWPGIIKNIFKGLDNEQYETYLLPIYAVKNLERDPLFQALEFYDTIYYCLFLKKEWIHYEELKEILISHEAMPYDEFKSKIRPLLKQKLGKAHSS